MYILLGFVLMCLGVFVFQVFDSDRRNWVVPLTRVLVVFGSAIISLSVIRYIIQLF